MFVKLPVYPLISIAPMVDWTYTHFRVLMRLLAPHVLLYTDMQTPGAILHNPQRAIDYHTMEHPLALQLGGADIADLVRCAVLAAARGFVEINLNLGCPSDRVQAGRFGACMMAEGAHVAECIRAMKAAVQIPVTAKTRIGIDQQDSYEFFATFVQQLIEAGCDKLIVHARKAWLHGLNPKQNRTIPPLHYDYVYRIKQELPETPVIINGNIQSITEITQHLTQVDGVMLGRLACQNPYAIAQIDHHFYPNSQLPLRQEVLQQYLDYALVAQQNGARLSVLLKPIFNLAHGLAGAKHWKAHLNALQRLGRLTDTDAIVALMQQLEK